MSEPEKEEVKSVEPTPAQPDALDAAVRIVDPVKPVEVEQVKSDLKTTVSLPIQAKGAHLVGLVVTSIIALFVAACLADGRSVVVLKDARDLPRLTDPKWIKDGLDYRADELLGPTYGVGIHHDASGYTWTECGAKHTLQTYIDELGVHQVIAAVPSVIADDGLKHPVYFLQCNDLKKAGLSAMSLAIIAEVVSACMIVFHGLSLLGIMGGLVKAKIAKVFACGTWFVLTTGFMIVIGLALAVMEETWECDNPFIPTIKLSDHFYYNYGIAFGYIGYVSALLVFGVMVVFTSTVDGVPRPASARESYAVSSKGYAKKPLCKLFGIVLVGLLVNMVISLSVVGGMGYFDSADEVDPDLNICAKQKPYSAGPGDKYFENTPCTTEEGIVRVLEQAGANVTRGYRGELDAGTWRDPITKRYKDTDLCPVNVHWHLGAEHLSVGEFDEQGTGPADKSSRRQLAGAMRLGNRCHHYDSSQEMFTKPYNWSYCEGMVIGETYEVHWPHSAAGACGTKWQYQTPFYDGVFCNDGIINILTPLNTFEKIGVQAQVFTIVNDESYKVDNLFDGMIVNDAWGQDIAVYTGSTTGTSRNNDDKCSRYSPITWQVDRKCHLVSASSFDQMCKMMLDQADDMKTDVEPHGSRELVADHLVANNQQGLDERRRLRHIR